jgi:hypothetical protein
MELWGTHTLNTQKAYNCFQYNLGGEILKIFYQNS